MEPIGEPVGRAVKGRVDARECITSEHGLGVLLDELLINALARLRVPAGVELV